MTAAAARRSRSKRVWLPLALVAGAYYAAPRMMARAFAPPQRAANDRPAGLGLPEEQVWLESVTGTRLHGWFIPVDGEAPAVVVLHGWGGNASLMLPLAPYLHEAGFHALFLDARNHGASEHDSFSSMPRFAEDLEVAAGWLRAHSDVTSLGVVGHSVGAGAAILSASQGGRYQAVVAVSSFAHPGEMMRDQMKSIPGILLTLILGFMQHMIGYRFDDLAPRNRIPHVEAPVMLVHGDADAVVPIDSLHELAAAHPGAELLVVPDGGHSDLAPFEPYIGEITTFLERHLRS
jgi:pimeloyl-ACP methyl ester carboxylesterase